MSQQQSPLRSLFWPGFVLGFLLLASVTCGGLAAALGFSEISLSDLQVGAPPWTPPPVTATPADLTASNRVDDAQTSGPTNQFAIGSTVRNAASSRVNIRRTPGYLGKGADDVLAQLQPGDTMTVLDGVADADNLRWRRIRFQAPGGANVEGWVAEATASGVVILQ